MGRKEKVGVCGRVVASSIAGLVAAFVGSEMLEGARQAKSDKSLLGQMCLATFFSLWASWEILQVRQDLGLTAEIEDVK